MDSDKDLSLAEEQNQESLLWEYLEEGEYDYERPQRGDIRDGIILHKEEERIVVDIGSKREGMVPSTDLEKLGPEAVAALAVGDEVRVYVLKPETQDGEIIVSINLARQVADWDRAQELMEANEIIEETISGFNKGGLLVDFGRLQGFIPRSHIVNLDGRTKRGPALDRLAQLVGETVPLKVIEVNQRQRRLILSERAAWREWRAEQKEQLLENLDVGQVRIGTVTSIVDFGAFVDLGGADGLIHLSELSWDRSRKPRDVLSVGDEIEVKVISLDRERMRIGLSLKQLESNPWDTLEERYAISQYIDVVVTNVAEFGAFARLEEGIEGLIHISELADHNVQHPSHVVEPGETLTVQILSLEPQRKRVGLSLRRVPEHLRAPAEPPVETDAELATEAAETPAAELAEQAAPVPAAEPSTEEPDASAGLEASTVADDIRGEPASDADEAPSSADRVGAPSGGNGDKHQLSEEDAEVMAVSEPPHQ